MSKKPRRRPVANFKSKKTGQRVDIFSKRGESRKSAIKRVTKKHGNAPTDATSGS